MAKRKPSKKTATKKIRRRTDDDMENFKDYPFEPKITPSMLEAVGVKIKKPRRR